MSKKADDLLRALWSSNIRFPMAPDRSDLTDEELERTQELPAPAEPLVVAEPPAAAPAEPQEFIVNIPMSQVFRYLEAVDEEGDQ